MRDLKSRLETFIGLMPCLLPAEIADFARHMMPMTGVPARHVRDLSGVRTCDCSWTCSFAFLIYVFIFSVFIFPGEFGSVLTKPES